MHSLMERVREWLGVPYTPDWEREVVERTLADQRQRLARIDEGMVVRTARHRQVFPASEASGERCLRD